MLLTKLSNLSAAARVNFLANKKHGAGCSRFVHHSLLYSVSKYMLSMPCSSSIHCRHSISYYNLNIPKSFTTANRLPYYSVGIVTSVMSVVDGKYETCHQDHATTIINSTNKLHSPKNHSQI